MLPLAFSYGVMAATLLVCDFARNQVLPFFLVGGGAQSSLAYKVLMDALLSVELCATAFEMGAIIEHYGLGAWMLGLFFLCFYQVLRWKDAPFPNPYVHLINYLAGLETATVAALRSAVVLAFGLLSYRLAKAVWALELTPHHLGRGASVDACAVPWSDVPTWLSAASELVGSVVLNVVPRLAFEDRRLANNDPRYTAALVSAFVLVTVFAALSYSGGMFNPMLATVLLGGCQGHDYLQHILIYWVASTAGAVAAFYIHPHIQAVVAPHQEEKKVA